MAKIGFITTLEYLPWGGSENLWYHAAIELNKNNTVSANVPYWNPVPNHIKELINNNIEISYRNRPLTITQRIINRIKYPAKPHESHFQWLDTFKPDFVVFSQSAYSEGIDWMEACSKRNIPYCNIVHIASEIMGVNDLNAERLTKCFNDSKNVFFVSKSTLKKAEELIADKIDNAEVFFNPYPNIRTSISYPKQEKATFAFVGRVEYIKGIDLLINVFKQNKWKNKNIIINLYGTGEQERIFKKLVSKNNIQNLKFRGFTKIDKIWEECQALILPSRAEGLPLVIVEAMLYKRMVIATDVGGNAELIDNNETGYLIPDVTVKDIDKTLDIALKNKDKWQEMGEKGYEKIKTVLPENPIKDLCQKIESLI